MEKEEVSRPIKEHEETEEVVVLERKQDGRSGPFNPLAHACHHCINAS